MRAKPPKATGFPTTRKPKQQIDKNKRVTVKAKSSKPTNTQFLDTKSNLENIFVDESDYMSDQDMNSFKATSTPHTSVLDIVDFNKGEAEMAKIKKYGTKNGGKSSLLKSNVSRRQRSIPIDNRISDIIEEGVEKSQVFDATPSKVTTSSTLKTDRIPKKEILVELTTKKTKGTLVKNKAKKKNLDCIPDEVPLIRLPLRINLDESNRFNIVRSENLALKNTNFTEENIKRYENKTKETESSAKENVIAESNYYKTISENPNSHEISDMDKKKNKSLKSKKIQVLKLKGKSSLESNPTSYSQLKEQNSHTKSNTNRHGEVQIQNDSQPNIRKQRNEQKSKSSNLSRPSDMILASAGRGLRNGKKVNNKRVSGENKDIPSISRDELKEIIGFQKFNSIQANLFHKLDNPKITKNSRKLVKGTKNVSRRRNKTSTILKVQILTGKQLLALCLRGKDPIDLLSRKY